MNKKLFKVFSVLLVLCALLFVCVGCADNVEDTDEVTYIDFGRESASSRGIESWNESLYPPESLYWTYTAKKIRGNYTTGQTLAEATVLKNGPAPGLGTVGPFSVGVWEFKLYGYLKCEENADGTLKFSDLVYTGKTGTADNAYTTTIDKRPAGTPGVQEIIFELSTDEDSRAETFWGNEKGVLELKNMYLTVPEGQKLTVKPSTTTLVRVTVTDVTDSTSKKVAVSTTNLTVTDGIKESGARFDLNNFEFESAYSPVAKFDAGVRNLQFKAEYKDVFTSAETAEYPDPVSSGTDTGWAEIGTISTYSVPFTKGVKTTLSGDINDIKVDTDENAHKDTFTGAVVKILNNTRTEAEGSNAYDLYGSIAEAMKYYGDSDHTTSSVANPIIVIHNIDNGGSVALTKDLVVKVTDENNDKHFIENLTVSGDKKITFGLNYADTTRDYNFSKGKIVNLSYTDDSAVIQTEKGTLDAIAPNDSVYHTGTADNVKITSVSKAAGKGYFLGTTKEGTSPITSVSTLTLVAGNLELGSYAAVNALTISATSTSDGTVKGRLTTEVGNIDTLRDGGNAYGGILKEYTFKAGRGTGSDKYYYGIEGMYLNAVNTFTAPTTPAGQTFNGWNTASDYSGDSYSAKFEVESAGKTLYAVWGNPVAKILKADGSYAYYGTLEAAVKAYTSNPVILMQNIDGESFTPTVAGKVNLDGYSVTNLTLSGTTAVEFDVDGVATRAVSFANGKMNRLRLGGVSEIDTTGGNVGINSTSDSDVFRHTGTIGTVAVTNCAGLYELGAAAGTVTVATGNVAIDNTVTTLTVNGGNVEIDANITTLDITGSTAVVKGKPGTDAVVTTCKYSGTQVNKWSTTSTTYAPYKQVSLNPYGGTFKLNGTSFASSSLVYYNYVENLKLTLPDTTGTTPIVGTPAGIKNLGWDDDIYRRGNLYPEKAVITIGSTSLQLVVRWGETVIKMMMTDGTCAEFGFLEAAANMYGNAKFKPDGTASRLVLVGDIESGRVKTETHIDCNGHSLKDVSVASGATGNYNIWAYPGTGSDEWFIACVNTSSGAKLNSLRYEGNRLYVDTTNLSTNCSTPSFDVWHTGVCDSSYSVNVSAVKNSKATNEGYHAHLSRINILNIATDGGYIDMGENTVITKLQFGTSAATVLPKTTLHATPSTVIGNIADYDGISKTSAVASVTGQTAFRTVTLYPNGGKWVSDATKTGAITYYAIDGMGFKIPKMAALFTGPTVDSPFEGWFGNAAGTGTKYGNDNAFLQVTNTSTWNLYAKWGRSAVGGRIFYVQTGGNYSTDKAKYTFYNAAGTAIAASTWNTLTDGYAVADALKDAVTYTCTVAEASKTTDYFYVVDTTNYFVGPIMWGGYGTAVKNSAGNFMYYEDPGYGGNGEGHWRCVFDTDTGRVKSGYDILFKSLNSSKTDDGKKNTMWAYVDYINDYSNTKDSNGKYSTTASYSGKVQRPAGCRDWFIGTGQIVYHLGEWCGALLHGAGSAWASGWAFHTDTGKTTVDTTKTYADSARYVAGDTVKETIFNGFKNHNIWVSGQGDGSAATATDKHKNFGSMWLSPLSGKVSTTSWSGHAGQPGIWYHLGTGVYTSGARTGQDPSAKYNDVDNYVILIRSF